MGPIEDGWADGLRQEGPKQDSTKLQAIMEAANAAHLELKQVLAPNTGWSQEDMNDILEVGYEDERRRVVREAGVSDRWELVPGATLVDCGVKAIGRVFEKAKWRQRPEQVSPDFSEALDISRIIVVFNSCKELLEGLERLQQSLDVVSLENRFLNPLCMGHRCIMMTVRQQVDVEHDAGVAAIYGSEVHYCKLILEHKSMFAVKEGSGANRFKQVQSHLNGIGIAPRELANLRRIVLRELGCTKAQAAQVQEQELHRVLACANAASTLAQSDGPALAQRLKDEAIEQALAAGVPQMRVIAATTR